ncbi:hydrogenase nickel incorporation protein HypB [Pseudonocardia xinjiangensis]|uniref:Hydrogenase nickel incorporation protein HypB n=1 Tax=Pseudonocardia xinjiangensis TaxID=75289 RepID=A0ABX1RD55_9PSEU|nr:hydrogenase nickel incorporation protein HypB [Pseudonocardia xinjiangensis]NMH78315.1 hydrogenase nickel incorporation protein HypB [Pseudonocardia xinjiangensis]
MCATCGCSDDAGVRVTDPVAAGHDHPHDHGDGHGHGHREPDSRTVALEVDLLAKNDDLAGDNRRWLAEREVVALNLMSSPGSGKTTLLTRTITDLGDELPCAVLEGDQETLLDAERIGATGARVIQINTGAGCHLDADMVAAGLRALAPARGSLLFVENVGNLVCPALFDLGEAGRVVIMSVTEGADKPLKYPHMFRTADLMLVNKVDLLPYVDFDVEYCVTAARRANPAVEVLEISATRGDGLESWYDWLRRRAGALTA